MQNCWSNTSHLLFTSAMSWQNVRHMRGENSLFVRLIHPTRARFLMSITPKWVRDQRKAADMTQEEFGAALKPPVSRFAVSHWEKGQHAIPSDIVERMKAGNIRPATQDPTAIISPKTHPQCFQLKAAMPWHYFTLAHPRWYYSTDCPLRHDVPAEYRAQATVADYDAHKAPAPETVWKLLQDFCAARSEKDVVLARKQSLAFMNALGYTQFGEPEPFTPDVPTSAIIGL